MTTFDAYMRIIFPEDLPVRIIDFMSGKRDFPFIDRTEISCIFYLYGKNKRVRENEIQNVLDLANNTVNEISIEIEKNKNIDKKLLNSETIRSGYYNRLLQMSILSKGYSIGFDPFIIRDCFVKHVSYHDQDISYHLFGPLKEKEIINRLKEVLEGRMVLLLFNTKEDKIPFAHPLIALYSFLM